MIVKHFGHKRQPAACGIHESTRNVVFYPRQSVTKIVGKRRPYRASGEGSQHGESFRMPHMSLRATPVPSKYAETAQEAQSASRRRVEFPAGRIPRSRPALGSGAQQRTHQIYVRPPGNGDVAHSESAYSGARRSRLRCPGTLACSCPRVSLRNCGQAGQECEHVPSSVRRNAGISACERGIKEGWKTAGLAILLSSFALPPHFSSVPSALRRRAARLRAWYTRRLRPPLHSSNLGLNFDASTLYAAMPGTRYVVGSPRLDLALTRTTAICNTPNLWRSTV